MSVQDAEASSNIHLKSGSLDQSLNPCAVEPEMKSKVTFSFVHLEKCT